MTPCFSVSSKKVQWMGLFWERSSTGFFGTCCRLTEGQIAQRTDGRSRRNSTSELTSTSSIDWCKISKKLTVGSPAAQATRSEYSRSFLTSILRSRTKSTNRNMLHLDLVRNTPVICSLLIKKYDKAAEAKRDLFSEQNLKLKDVY
jgi:hypothetical protein